MPGGARALGWIRSLPDHRLLDRLIGGRVWIVLIGTLLVGLVTVQLSLLKLNAGIGRAVERGAALEQSNAGLRASISALSNSERVIAEATALGYVVPLQGTPRFRMASANDSLTALTVMRTPDPSATTTTAAALPLETATTATTTTTTDTTATDTTVDPTATSDTTSDVTTAAPPTTTAVPTTAVPPATAPTSAGAGTTSGVAVTTGSTVAGGATAPTG